MVNEDSDRNLSIVRGGLYATPRSTPERQCAERVRAAIYALLGGRKKSRALRRLQAGAANPTLEPMKVARRLKEARVPFAETWGVVIEPQARGIAAMYGMQFDTEDFTPPTPAAPAAQQRAA